MENVDSYVRERMNKCDSVNKEVKVMSNYSKHKDREPRDTIFEIQRILNNAGLFTVLQWVDKAYDGARSNRATLYPTHLGANGKGTDELYSTASAYAELMERIQNNALTLRLPRRRVVFHGDFHEFPDEKYMSIRDVIAQDDPFLHYVFETLHYDDVLKKTLLLRKFASYFDICEEGSILTVPYVDVKTGRILYIPPDAVFGVCGSNGMAAGNTIEEALVQGMSELYERYVNVKLLRGEAVPPEIPQEELRKYSIWNLIEQVEAGGRYKVSVRDCSLGMGLPVAAVIIVDRERGSLGVKLGAHPSIAVAVERTLTEALQGKNMEAMTGSSRVGSREEAVAYHNIPNALKIGAGVYPATLLTREPDWEYRPWTEWEGLDNSQFLQRMLMLAERDGLRLLVRDNSHMGFPAVQIIVPGYSNLYPLNDTLIRSLNSEAHVSQIFNHCPDWTEQEETQFLRLICFKEYSAIENGIDFMTRHPFFIRSMSSDRFGAYLALKLGDYAKAVHFFGKLSVYPVDDDAPLYYRAMKQYAQARLLGMDDMEANRLVAALYLPDIAQRVKDDTADIPGLLRKKFPETRCFDCEHCQLNGKGCENRIEEEMMIKIKDAMAASPRVSQEALLRRLRELANA